MRNTIFAFVMTLILFITACVVDRNNKPTIDNSLLVKVAVAEVLYRNPTWKPEANKICMAILNGSDGGKTITDLEAKARIEVDKLDVSPSTRILAQELITAISTGIKADLQQRGITDINVQYSQAIGFIRWLETATR